MQLLFNKWYIQLFFLAIAVTASYCCTLDVPFYLDDFSSIQENPTIYNWQGTLGELWQFSALRIIGYFSFALNYQIHQFQVAGYHIVNIFIHFLAGCALWGLFHGLVRTPVLDKALSAEAKQWLPFLVALVFLLHPLQIQAVTYIVQRLASLAALFYLASMACFIQARLTTLSLHRMIWAIACLIFAILAFFTKQNAATLPIALLLLEWLFFLGDKKRLFLAGALSLFGLVMIWGIMALVFHQNPFSLQAMQALTQETTTISRHSYFVTQFNVLWTYIRLFFVPIGLHIDYDYPIVTSLWQGRTFIALIGHLLLIGGALYSIRRLPLVAFGILFYYLTHAVESSVIPISDVVFEHRTYLPNVGLIAVCGWLFVTVFPQWFNWQTLQISFSILLLIMAVATWQRNQLWRDPIALWQNNVEQSPDKKRAWIILGKHLLQEGKATEGITALERSAQVEINADGTISSKTYTIETILNLVVAYKMLGQHEKALSLIQEALQNPRLRGFDRAKFLVNQGNVFFEQGHHTEAESAYRQAIQAYPQNLIAQLNLANILAMMGRLEEAKVFFQQVLAIDPSNVIAREHLQKIHNLQ